MKIENYSVIKENLNLTNKCCEKYVKGQESHIDDLISDIWLEIATYLPIKDLIALSHTSRTLKRIISKSDIAKLFKITLEPPFVLYSSVPEDFLNYINGENISYISAKVTNYLIASLKKEINDSRLSALKKVDEYLDHIRIKSDSYDLCLDLIEENLEDVLGKLTLQPNNTDNTELKKVLQSLCIKITTQEFILIKIKADIDKFFSKRSRDYLEISYGLFNDIRYDYNEFVEYLKNYESVQSVDYEQEYYLAFSKVFPFLIDKWSEITNRKVLANCLKYANACFIKGVDSRFNYDVCNRWINRIKPDCKEFGIPEEFTNDKQIMKVAISLNKRYFYKLSKDLIDDPELIDLTEKVKSLERSIYDCVINFGFKIIEYLSVSDLIALSRTSRGFKELVRETDIAKLFKDTFELPSVSIRGIHKGYINYLSKDNILRVSKRVTDYLIKAFQEEEDNKYSTLEKVNEYLDHINIRSDSFDTCLELIGKQLECVIDDPTLKSDKVKVLQDLGLKINIQKFYENIARDTFILNKESSNCKKDLYDSILDKRYNLIGEEELNKNIDLGRSRYFPFEYDWSEISDRQIFTNCLMYGKTNFTRGINPDLDSNVNYYNYKTDGIRNEFNIPKIFTNDKQIMELAISLNKKYFYQASEDLKNDIDFKTFFEKQASGSCVIL